MLLFVVITLGVQFSRGRRALGVRAFVTPTLVHFGGVLFQAPILLSPWPSPRPVASILAQCGIAGWVYVANVIRRQRKVDLLRSICATGSPMRARRLANTALIAGAAGLFAEKSFAPYAIAGAVMLLLFTGIHDAWDLTMWIVKNRERHAAS